MAIFSASSSFIRYLVLGDIPEPFVESFTESINKNAFSDLEEGEEEEKSLGWVALGKIMDKDNVGGSFLHQNYISMSMRVDSKKVPGQILKTASLKEEAKIREATQREKLSSPEKKEIRDNMRKKLIRRAFPTTNMFDFSWNVTDKKIFFSSSNESVCTDFTDLFYNTFGLQLRPLFPYTIALGLPFDDEKSKMIDNTFPCDFRYS